MCSLWFIVRWMTTIGQYWFMVDDGWLIVKQLWLYPWFGRVSNIVPGQLQTLPSSWIAMTSDGKWWVPTIAEIAKIEGKKWLEGHAAHCRVTGADPTWSVIQMMLSPEDVIPRMCWPFGWPYKMRHIASSTCCFSCVKSALSKNMSISQIMQATHQAKCKLLFWY